MSITRLITEAIVILLLAYFIFGIFLFFSQRSMIYLPEKQDFNDCPGFADYQKMEHNGTRFYFKQQSTEKVIVYYHGNAGSACSRSYAKKLFEQANHSVLFVEYAGYANDKRKTSSELILQDVQNVKKFVEKKGFSHTTLYGESIGTGAASYHAHIGNADAMILVSPFSTLADVAQSKYRIYPAKVLLTEQYDNIGWLSDYHGKLLVLHGDKDRIIPSTFSKTLFETVPTEEREYVLIKGKGHNDIFNTAQFSEKITSFLKKEK